MHKYLFSNTKYKYLNDSTSKALIDVEVGLSDHTMGVGVVVASVALGASVIEKHFTIARADGGVDGAFSLSEEMAALVIETDRAWQAIGQVRYGPTEAETKSLVFRRSIYVSAEIAEGEFTSDNIRIVRPGNGAPPYLYNMLLGRRSTLFCVRDTLSFLDELI